MHQQYLPMEKHFSSYQIAQVASKQKMEIGATIFGLQRKKTDLTQFSFHLIISILCINGAI
jgi:hypothetical protein